MIEGLKIEKISMTMDARLNVMETALDAGHTHGIGYWAEVVKIKESMLEGKTRVGAMCLLDRDGGGTPDLAILGKNNALLPGGGQGVGGQLWITSEIIERAVTKMLSDPSGAECEGWLDALMTYDSPDGPLADVIIQVACFGKIVYA